MATQSATSPARGSAAVFDAALLGKLEQLELISRKLFRGLLRGEHIAARRGRGLEFSDFRRYRPGDDFRHIDWNIYSRLDQLFLKLHASEDDLTLHLVLDASASMGCGEPSKFDHARRLAAALACIGLANHDRVGLTAFADGLVAVLPPARTRRRLTGVLDFLRELPCAGATRYATALRTVATQARSPGVVILISDFLGGDDAARGIDALRYQGHDVVVIHLVAESDLDPPLEGRLRLIDAETGEAVDLTINEGLLALYRQRLDRALRDVEDFCRRRGIEYLRASTALPFEDIVLDHLRKGMHLR